MVLVSILLATVLLRPQQIPEGVRYKKAPEAVNKKAQAKLVGFFRAPELKADYLGMSDQVLICMPGMWKAIAKGAPKELSSAKPVTFYVPGSGEPQKFEGRLFKAHEQVTFWKLLRGLTGNKQPTIRKAKASELAYYWALISYDIEEPVFVADFGARQILFDFGGSKTEPKVLAVEVIGRSN